MDEPNKLPLLKQSLRMLVEQLEDEDTVSIVVYAGAAGAVLEPTPGAQRGKILAALENLSAGGSTAGGEGLRLAYSLAEQSFDPDAVNRIILATDGDFNVGVTDDERLEDFVARKRESGIYLSVLGFGQGNYNDALMQTIAQAGDGTAAYIDSLNEARKVLHDEMTGTLFPIADDVKIQIEFNPHRVAEYRLIGYETRMLRREDFSNDAVDAGEIGAGHEVTAVYEIAAPGSAGLRIEPSRYAPVEASLEDRGEELAFLRVRYKLPGEDDSRLIEQPITEANAVEDIAQASSETRWVAAVAAYGQLLRRDPYTEGYDFDDVIELAQGARGEDPFGYRAEFIQLARLADAAAALNPLEGKVAGGTQ
jgi:Ca-activated chloride channel family protein